MFFELSQDAVALGTAQIAPTLISFTLDANGSIPANTKIFFNDELAPSGTTYTVAVLAVGGGLVWGSESVSIVGTTFNLNNAQPTSQNVMLAGVVLTNPTAAQTITGFDLNLASANLNITTGNIAVTAGTVTVGSTVTTKSGFIIQKADGTLPATIANDTAGGVNITANSGKIWEFSNGGSLSSPAGNGIQFNGATSGAIALIASAIAGSNILTLPATTDTLVVLGTFATPPALGNTTPAAVNATTLTTTGLATKYNNVNTVANGLSATYGVDDKTAQSASIGTVTLITGGAATGGHYQWNITTGITTADASGATYTYTISWTQDGIARSFVSGAIAFASTANFSQVTGPIFADNSTNVTYITTVTGAPTTGRYAVHVWVTKY